MEHQEQKKAMFDDSNRVMIMLCHGAPFLGVGIIVPLVIYLKKKDESKDVAAHAREALNFQITYLIYALLSLPLFLVFLIGFFTMLAVICAVAVFAIIALIKANDGELYEYPFTMRFIKGGGVPSETIPEQENPEV